MYMYLKQHELFEFNRKFHFKTSSKAQVSKNELVFQDNHFLTNFFMKETLALSKFSIVTF